MTRSLQRSSPRPARRVRYRFGARRITRSTITTDTCCARGSAARSRGGAGKQVEGCHSMPRPLSHGESLVSEERNEGGRHAEARRRLGESGRPGSNRRRPAWEAGILPLNYARVRRLRTLAESCARGNGPRSSIRSALTTHRASSRAFSVKGHARNFMTERVSAIGPDTPIDEVARALVGGRFGGLPVTGPQGLVPGLVS